MVLHLSCPISFSWGSLLPKFRYGKSLIIYQKFDNESIPDNDIIPVDPVFILAICDWNTKEERDEHDYFYIDQGQKVRRKKKGFLRPIKIVDSLKIICSCNGLLLLRKPYSFQNPKAMKFSIRNPVTEEEISIPTTIEKVFICGFFYHTLTGDYRVLCQPREDEYSGFFMIFSLQTKSWRWLTEFFHPHVLFHNPITVDGTLHWMICHESFQGSAYVDRDIPIPCSNSILRFNILTEEFETMPHPEHEICSRIGKMHLLKMDEQLCLGHMHPRSIDIWILTDYSEWQWVKRYQISLDRHVKPKFIRIDYEYSIHLISIQNGELWIHWRGEGLFTYNLQSDILRKIVSLPKKAKGKLLKFIPYTKTFVSVL